MLTRCPTCQADCFEGTSFCPSCGGHLKQTSDPFIDRLVGKYKIEERIGDGGCSSVYRARHVDNGRPFAVKVLLPQYTSHEEMIERFRREAQVMSRLTHDNIVKIEDFGWVSGLGFYITMEWLEGETVKEYVFREGAMQKHEVLFFYAQLLDALNTAHSQGIVHRDLKLDNLMLTTGSFGRASLKILDFGVAYIESEGKDRLTNTGLVVGTPRYMAPEQVRGDNTQIDNRTDLYSCGLMLHEMLTGTPAFQRETVQQLLYCQLDEMPPLLNQAHSTQSFGPLLEGVVRKAVQKSHNDRYPSAFAFYEALEQAMMQEGVSLPTYVVLGAAPPQPTASSYSLLSSSYESSTPASRASSQHNAEINTPNEELENAEHPLAAVSALGSAFETIAMPPEMAPSIEGTVFDQQGVQSVSASQHEIATVYSVEHAPSSLRQEGLNENELSNTPMPSSHVEQYNYSAQSLDGVEGFNVSTDKETVGVTPSGSSYIQYNKPSEPSSQQGSTHRRDVDNRYSYPNIDPYDEDALHYSPLSLEQLPGLPTPSPEQGDEDYSPNKRHIFWVVAIPAILVSLIMVWFIQTMVKPDSTSNENQPTMSLPSVPNSEK